MLYPVMPAATREIWQQLNLSEELAQMDPAKLKWGELKEETPIGAVKPVFPRLDKTKIMEEIQRNTEDLSQKTEPNTQHSVLSTQHSGEHATEADAVARDQKSGVGGQTSAVNVQHSARSTQHSGEHTTEADAVPGVASFIDITDFTKVELRVGQVTTAARIPKSDKLLLLTVDIGEEKPRQILAGIAEHYAPEEMLGRKIAVVANLKPRKLRGHESQGMLLAASLGENDKPALATFSEDTPNGARLK
jgi:methionyl-tRNA synthetase